MGIKVDSNSRGKPQRITPGVDRSAGRVRDLSHSQFGNQLGRNLKDNQEEELQKKAKQIAEQGKKLSAHVDISELKAYKRLIMEFLDEAVKGTSKFSKESFLDRRGRHRVFATVKTINEKLESLTKSVLSTEQDHLEILGKIEDIRGLVLDLVL